MKGKECSWRDMRRIKAILEKVEEDGFRSALERCSARSTRSNWRRAIEFMSSLKGTFYHVQPTHAREIVRGFPEKTEEWSVWADKCENGQWTVQKLKTEIRNTITETNAPGKIEGKYRTIVIDPPWPVAKIEREERPKQKGWLDYPVMSVEEIMAFPLMDFAFPTGTHLYLWTTHKFLPTAIETIKAWSANYECLLTWVKPTGMTPFSWMYNTEHVIFARIGHLELLKKGVKLSFEAPVTRHSEKPDIFYEIVKSVSPEPRVDIFARRPRDGFVPWGNQVEAVGSRQEICR